MLLEKKMWFKPGGLGGGKINSRKKGGVAKKEEKS